MARLMSGRDKLPSFTQNFPTPLHCVQPESDDQGWVFWSQDEGSETNSSSGNHFTPLPYDNIKSAFSKLPCFSYRRLIVQLWAPVTIDGRRLLSTFGQPFSVNYLDNDLKNYRLRSMEYCYNIGFNNQLHIQQEENQEYPMIVSGGPAAAFLNRMSEFAHLKDHQGSPLARYAFEDCGLEVSFMMPICSPSQTSSCIGVVECTASFFNGRTILEKWRSALEEVGLNICPVQERIPYKTIHGLKPARDKIQAALKKVCRLRDLLLVQVWVAYEDDNHVPFSSSLEDSRTKSMIALKLTGYVDWGSKDVVHYYAGYYDTCDVVYLKAGEELVEKTLRDYKPRFCRNINKLSADTLMSNASVYNVETSGFAICLRNIDTGQLDYAFEFIWLYRSDYVMWLEALLLTLKKWLPRFKFASGAELGDEIEFRVICESTLSEIKSFKIFDGKKSSPITSETKGKTARKQLPREVIEQQFGNTMKEAAKNLKVSLSTLKRKCKEFGIYEWQGPNVMKREVNASSNNQSNINEEDNGEIQEPYVVNRNENTLTIKAEYADDMIKFDICTSQASLVTIEKKIGNTFNLTPRTYKLKYLDKDEDLILLTSDQDMSDCINYFRNLGQHVVRLRVLLSTLKPSS